MTGGAVSSFVGGVCSGVSSLSSFDEDDEEEEEEEINDVAEERSSGLDVPLISRALLLE